MKFSPRKIRDGLVRHVVSTTAGAAATIPITAVSEMTFIGMTAQQSEDLRLFSLKLGYGGLSFLWNWGRDYSRRLFSLAQDSKGVTLHDMLYGAAFSAVVAPIMYMYKGMSSEQVGWGSALSAGLSFLNGIVGGYATDVGRDLMGVEESKRRSYPNVIKRQSPLIKMGLAALIAAGSYGLMNGIYEWKSAHEHGAAVDVRPALTSTLNGGK